MSLHVPSRLCHAPEYDTVYIDTNVLPPADPLVQLRYKYKR